MRTREDILEDLLGAKSKVADFGIRELGLFGSYQRNEQTETSDIDILIDFVPQKETYDNFLAVYDLIEEIFKGQKVEIVTKNGLSPYLGPKNLNEVHYV